MQIPIVHRYLLKDVVANFVAILLVLLLILLGGVFVKLLGKVADGSIEFSLVFPLLLWGSVGSLTTLLVVSAFLAILLTMGTLYRNSEIYALRTMGIGDMALVRLFLWFGVAVALVLFLLAAWVSPHASMRTQELRHEAATRFDLSAVTPGRFIALPGNDRVIFAGGRSDDGEALEEIVLFSGRGNNLKIVTARTAVQIDDDDGNARFLDLAEGNFYQGAPGSDRYLAGRFGNNRINVPGAAATSHLRLKMLPLQQLLGSDDLGRRAELHWRLSFPFSLIVLTFLAVPLSHTSPRKGRFGRVAVAILLYVLYANLLGLGKNWIEAGVVPAGVGLWWVHALFMLLFMVLIWRQSGFRLRLPFSAAVN